MLNIVHIGGILNWKLRPGKRIFGIAGVMQCAVQQMDTPMYLLSYYSFVVEAGSQSIQSTTFECSMKICEVF